jgi:hypothetical protein
MWAGGPALLTLRGEPPHPDLAYTRRLRRAAGGKSLRMDPGPPSSFLDVETGVDVISSDGERVGTLEHVLHDEQTAIFDGVVIDVATGPGGHRFVDAPQVAEFRERAVLLAIPADAVDSLPEPSANPAVMQHGGAEDSEGPLTQKLRRAWDLISGRY